MKLTLVFTALLSIAIAGPHVYPASDEANVLDAASQLEIRKKPCTTNDINMNVNGSIVTHIKLERTLDKIPDKGPITQQQLQTLQGQVDTITSYLSNAIKSARCHKKLSEKDCQHILKVLSTSFKKAVFTVLQDLVDHLVAFQNAGVLPAICQDVDNACALIQQLFSALEAIASDPGCKASLKSLAKQFDTKCKATHMALGCP